MVKIVPVFLALFIAFFLVLSLLTPLKRRQKFRLLKLTVYSSVCSLITVGIVAAILYFFFR